MPRANKSEVLGRSLARHRDRRREVSSRHTTDEGSIFASENTAISITETTALDEFLSNAEASHRSFEAERGVAAIVGHEAADGLDVIDEREGEDEDDDEDGPFCSVPKKPDWRAFDTKEEFQEAEQASFLKWRKRLNK